MDEAKEIRDTAEAMRAYGRQAKNKQLEIDAAEIRIRAERRVGELIVAAKANKQVSRGQPPKKNSSDLEGFSRVKLAEHGIDWKLSARAQQLAAVPEKKFEAMLGDWRERITTETERVTTNLLREGEREQKREARVAQALPSGVFRLLYADPPWRYEHIETESRAVAKRVDSETATHDRKPIENRPEREGRAGRISKRDANGQRYG